MYDIVWNMIYFKIHGTKTKKFLLDYFFKYIYSSRDFLYNFVTRKIEWKVKFITFSFFIRNRYIKEMTFYWHIRFTILSVFFLLHWNILTAWSFFLRLLYYKILSPKCIQYLRKFEISAWFIFYHIWKKIHPSSHLFLPRFYLDFARFV